MTYLATGARIALLRKTAGINQRAFAGQVGLSVDSLARMEKGWRKANVEDLLAAAVVLGVHPADLLPSPKQISAPPTLDLKEHHRIAGALMKIAIDAGADPVVIVTALEPCRNYTPEETE